ncbi:plasmid stabilization system protein ParE [Pseudomonas sp. WPR_5_2]|uniref:type II toxin-antitoxin system RelE/ParE family toxin n=1 Tax=Pseudomonas sp. WPR_5_2 TaxID=1907371 RepID=UPI000EB31E38|nr:type II toxin-antitoxin system RelE/ParE family toxin [Pseudomonas sp. WPR_5_2]RKS23466.1 plasmid stabilization system protein ParE [Pseudomonas sp. WPR_5_2]
MPSVVLTEKAESDLDNIHEHYREVVGAGAAIEIISTILQSFQLLEQFPGSGRPSVMPDVRELILGRYPFIAPYRFAHGQIQVLRVLHQRSERSQDW